MPSAPSPQERFLAIVENVRRQGLTDDVRELETWIAEAAEPWLEGEMAKLLGFYWLRQGEPARAIHWSDRARTRLPQDWECLYNAIFARFQAGRWDEVVREGEAALAQGQESLELRNILCTALGALGRLDAARRHGTFALRLKDQAATAAPHPLAGIPVPPFDPAAPSRNIISFSLYGDLPKYTEGAILNARAAPFLYPGWTCRFHVDDSVPPAVQAALIHEGAQVMRVEGLPRAPYGTFWRFLVADDPAVDRYLLRDADSLINTRERVAVDAWIASGRHFHAMRDHFDHPELVLAGMWGGVRGALAPILPQVAAWFAAQRRVLGVTADQEFLREALWPTIRQSVLVHDSQFDFPPAEPFPPYGALPPGCHVGCQWRQMPPHAPVPSP